MRSLVGKIAVMSLGAFLVFGKGPTLVSALELVITDNGGGSDNEVNVQAESTTTVEQVNEAAIVNEVDTSADTGDNTASSNTGGDVGIETGDVSQTVEIETSANSSEVDVPCCPDETQMEISGNGSDSQNAIELTQTDETNITVDQEAKVANKIEGKANTGENNANDNTGGDVSIDTGNISVTAVIENSPVNSASVRVASSVGPVSAKISENGSGSDNIIKADLVNGTSTFLNFTAGIDNFVNWDLNTGRNNANGNTGGDVSISTGDIDFNLFIKNLVNIGEVEVDCCDIFDPGGDEPVDEEDPGDGQEPEEPKGGPSDDGGGDGDGDDDSQGTLLPSAAATEAGGPGIIGLSDTSSDLAQTIFFWAGIIMIIIGARLIGREASSKISA